MKCSTNDSEWHLGLFGGHYGSSTFDRPNEEGFWAPEALRQVSSRSGVVIPDAG